VLIVGLTGGIGCGKSRAAELFEGHGVPVIDADLLAREAVSPGSSGIREVEDYFGPQYLCADGSLDRGRMRARIFRDPEARGVLEGIIHPIVRREISRWNAEQRAPYVIHVIPLLLEKGLERSVHRVLVVDCLPEQQVARAVARDGVTEADIEAVIASQVSRAERLARADDVIDNGADAGALEAAVSAKHQDYMRLAVQQVPT
jgi:dephospho-CoA kinase